jgi:hypothetical protein
LASIPSKVFDDSIRKLEVGLRQLKVQYDQFFAGALDREPLHLRRELEKVMHQLNQNPPDKLVMRFRYNAVLGRFNCFAELWNKTLRNHEEGGRRTASVAERLGIKERLLTRCLVGQTEGDDPGLRRLHRRYVETRERHGKRGIPFEKFARGISSQVRRLRDSHECAQIEVRLVERGEDVEIRARPGSVPTRRPGVS